MIKSEAIICFSMPFTFSHPAIVLPLSYLPRKWRSMTGLIMGSMAPDFEKFIRMEAYDAYSHTWESIFYFNLPVSILLSFLFHQVVRNMLIDNLPGFIQERVMIYKEFDWVTYLKKHYGIVVLSILTGTFSHIAWDAFTHADGRFVNWLPFLQYDVAIGNYETKVYEFLQMFTSVVGALLIAVALLMLPRYKVPEGNNNKLIYWVVVTGVAFVIVVIRYIFGFHLSYFLNLLISIIAAGLLSLSVSPFLIKKFNLLKTAPQT